MIKLDATDYLRNKMAPLANPEDQNQERKAILLTGAHHARELVSVQMPLYVVVDLLHGFVHQDREKMELLRRNKYFVIPFVNTDASHTIW